MRREYIELEQHPEHIGIDYMFTIIPEELRMAPDCKCPARTCPNHGFCYYCKQHHDEINRMIVAEGHPEAVHGCSCQHGHIDAHEYQKLKEAGEL